jgi:Domain of unknown function DUF29
MATTIKTLYDTDLAAWAAHTAELLRAGRLDELDLENVAGEIESLGKSQHRAVRSQLTRMLKHKVKQMIQPERDGTSWRGSFAGALIKIHGHLEDSPSLRPYLEQNLQRFYQDAVKLAVIETGLEHAEIPERCPWTLDALLAGEL